MTRITFIAIILLPVLSFGQSTIGDVKYSILDPDSFNEHNGSGWVIMMGQDISGSDLALATGINTLPDGRGVFIRSMNLGRTEGGDPEGDRPVGDSQQDDLKSHKHKISDYKSHVKVHDSHIGPWDGSSFGEYEEETTSVGGKETRPKNIILYTYIKINNQ